MKILLLSLSLSASQIRLEKNDRINKLIVQKVTSVSHLLTLFDLLICFQLNLFFSQGDQGPVGPTGPRGAPGIGITGPKVRREGGRPLINRMFVQETETQILIVIDSQLLLCLIASKLFCIFYLTNSPVNHSWLVHQMFESVSLSIMEATERLLWVESL